MRRRQALLALAGLASGAALARDGAPLQIEILSGDDSEVSRTIADDLRPRLPPSAPSAHKGRKVTVAIGPLALQAACARAPDGVIISAFTSSQVWQAQLARMPRARAHALTALYAEPAPADQLRLIGLVFKKPVPVAAILSHETAYLRAQLIANDSMPVRVETVDENLDLNRILNRVASAKVLLALPDRVVFNTDNIRNILLSTYRHNQGVIGFSADMVQTGALASTYSDIADINIQLAEMVAEYGASGVLPAPQYPRYFKVIVNDGVARSLGVTVDLAARSFARRPPANPL